MPGAYDTTIYIGDNWQRTVTITNPAGNLVDLTGYTARWYVKTEASATTTLVEMTTTNGRITIAGSTLTATLTAAVTALLAPGIFVHDLEITTGGVVTSYLAGAMTITQDVSR